MSHTERTERRAERKEAGEDDSEEDEPVEIPLSAVTMHPKGTPAPASSVEVQVSEVSQCYTRPSMDDGAHALAEHTRGGVCVLREGHRHRQK